MNKIASLKWMSNGFKSFLNLQLCEVEIKIYISFLLIILVGFWPISSGLFSLKNDEINYFLPYRYTIVESLRNGQFPLWSPYIYMGSPISGDMQSGVWNPLVWLLALTGRYSLTTLHAELLIYIYFAAIGMFKLMQVLRFSNTVNVTIAVSYAFCGFIIDSGQFMCWESCACFLPYTYLYFIRLLEHPRMTVSAKFALANFGLLIAGGYPFFFIANIYFLAIAFLVFIIIARRKHEIRNALMAFRYLVFSVVLFLLLSTAPLLSFINLLPYYARGTHLPLKDALFNSYSLFSSISFLFPFSITRDHINFGNNNVLSRNLYIGIVLLPFVIKGVVTHRTIIWNTVLFCIILAFILSAGEMLPFRKWAYWWLPLMNTFRHPSNFRLFISVGLLSFAGKGLNEFLSSFREENKGMIMKIFYGILLCLLIVGIYYLPLKESNPFRHASISPEELKTILNNISFKQGVLLSLLVQIPFLLGAILLFRKNNYTMLCMLSLLNIIALAQPQLLSSTVSKNPVFKINEFIRSQPTGFPTPDLTQPISFPDEKKIFIYEYKEPVSYFFNKKIAVNTLITNPTTLKTYNNFINNSGLLLSIKNCPLIYLADSISQYISAPILKTKKTYWLQTLKRNGQPNQGNNISINTFRPGMFELAIKTDTTGFLVILQNNFTGWKANIKNKTVPIETVNETFMGLRIPAGTYTLTVCYNPRWFLPGVILSMIGLLLILFFLMAKPRNKYNTHL